MNVSKENFVDVLDALMEKGININSVSSVDDHTISIEIADHEDFISSSACSDTFDDTNEKENKDLDEMNELLTVDCEDDFETEDNLEAEDEKTSKKDIQFGDILIDMNHHIPSIVVDIDDNSWHAYTLLDPEGNRFRESNKAILSRRYRKSGNIFRLDLY